MLDNIVYLSSFLASIGVAFFVLLKNKSSKLNRTFFWFSISASGWIISLYFFYFYNNGLVLFLGRLNFVFTELVAYFAFLFGYWFPRKTFEITNKVKILLLLWLFFLIGITLFSDLIDKNETITQNGIETTFGSLYIIFVLHFLVFFSLLIILPALKYKKLMILEKYQVNYLLVGTFLTLVFSSTTNIFLPLFFRYYNAQYLGPIGVFFLIGFITYAIVKHRLMDIKLVMRQYSVFIVSFIVIAVPAAFMVQLYELIVPKQKIWINFLIIFLAIYFFPICRDFFYRFANKYLFSSLYDSTQVIAKLSDRLRSTLFLGKVYEYIYESLNGAFHLKAFGVLGHEEKSDYYYVHYNRGFEIGGAITFPGNKKLHDQYTKVNKPMIVQELKTEKHDPKIKKLMTLLSGFKVEILIPLNVKDKTVGLLALGQKESGDIYNEEDFKMLEVIGAQAAIAIENAMLYEDAKNFNIKMEEEVKKATTELRDANVKLKKLDVSKSEFISIASHQLRTPLTVIKGYVSMILEGSFGKVAASQRDSLDKVYQSNERLIQLVENLLNLSRIESGRLQYKYEYLHLENTITSVIEELSGKAKDKKIKLIYEQPEKLPKVNIDEEKMRQVIMNLIDNAVKYTNKGSVTVSLKKEDNNLKFCVSDSGMGIDEKDKPYLFQKFQRGTGTFLVHTEGTGLGLYVAKEMITGHQGKIWAESKGPGKGSKFFFTIPIENK